MNHAIYVKCVNYAKSCNYARSSMQDCKYTNYAGYYGNYVIVIYCADACSHFHVMFDDFIVYNSCTYISCGVDIIHVLPNQ